MAPESVKNMKAIVKKLIPTVNTSRVKAWNYSAARLLRTYSTKTKIYMRMKTQCETRCSLDLITEKLTKVICIASIEPRV